MEVAATADKPTLVSKVLTYFEEKRSGAGHEYGGLEVSVVVLLKG